MAQGADVVRAFPYPVLDEGNLSFPNGVYAPELTVGRSGDEMHVKHRLLGARFIERMVEDGTAAFCCSISIPITGYRELQLCLSGREQTVSWNPEYVGEPPYIRPMVVSTHDVSIEIVREDDTHDGWVGRKVSIKKGAKLALGPFYRTASALQHLLVFQCDSALKPGQFTLNEPASTEGFYFRVKIAEDLLAFLKNPEYDVLRPHRRSILTHVVSCCLQKLKDDYGDDGTGEDGWQAYRNLVALNDQLELSGIPPWSDPQFSPEQAATAMYPHLVARPPSVDEDVVE